MASTILTPDRAQVLRDELAPIKAAVTDSDLAKAREYSERVNKLIDEFLELGLPLSDSLVEVVRAKMNSYISPAKASIAAIEIRDTAAIFAEMQALPDPA